MIQIFHPNDICSEVLSLKAEVRGKYNGLPQDLFELIKNLKFPVFGSFELMRIRKELSDHDEDMVEILKRHKFTFCFLPDQIERFVKTPDKSNEYTAFLACYIFYSYLSFEIITKTCTDQHILVDFFRFFNYIAQDDRFSINPEYRKIALGFAYFGFLKYLQGPLDSTVNLFLPQINDFFFYNNDLPPVSFNILIQTANVIFNLPNNVENERTKTNFLTIADGLVQQIRKYFPPNVAMEILQRSFSSIRKLDISALSFLYHSSEIVDQHIIVSCVYLFPPAIMSLVEENTEIRKVPTQETTKHVKLVSIDVPEIAFKPIENSNLTENDLYMKTKFPETIKIESFFPKSIEPQIAFLMRLLVSNQAIATAFIEASTPFIIGSLETANYINAYSLFLFFFIRIRNAFPVAFIEETLFNEKIFDYNITVYDSVEGFDVINTIRDECFKLILKDENPNCCYMIRHILLDIYKYPLLYAETVARLMKYGNEYLQNIIFVSNIVQGLMKPMTFYQSFQSSAIEPRVMEEVKIARKSILTFLFTYLADPAILSSFMSNDYFAKSFFCLIFEEPLRETVIAFITVFMSDNNNKDNVVIDQLIQIMFLVFSSDFIHQGKSKLLVIPARILACVNSCLRSIPELVMKFEQIIDPILHSIICIQGSDHEEYLIQLILFLVYLTPIHLLKPHEAAALLKASSQLGKSDPSANLSTAIIQLIAGKETTQKTHDFIIQQPHALTLYLNIYINSKQLLECTQTLYDICKSSEKNCIKAHEGELDLFCIELLSQQKTKQEVDMDIIHSLLSIVDLISSTVSSVSVVQSFISLFCPIEGKFLSPFHNDCIDFIDEKIKKAYVTPQADWALIPGAAIEIRGLTTQQISSTFSFSFWFFPVRSDRLVPIITVNDTYDSMLSLVFVKQTLRIDILSQEVHSSNPVIECLTTNKWCYVNVEMKFLENSTTACVNIDDSLVFDKRDMPPVRMKRGSIYTTINYQKASNENTVSPEAAASRIGPFALLQTEDNALYKQGPRRFSPNQQTTIFAFKPENINGRFVLTRLHQTEGIDGVYVKPRIKLNQKFTDVLFESCKFTLILPLFAQMDMCEKSGRKHEDLIFKVIAMTKRALLLSPSVISQFQQSNAFAIIEHLLNVSNESNITYKLYLAFYDLMVDLPSSELLREDLFNQIVCNPSVWIHATPAENRQILVHWTKELTKKVPSYIFDSREFRWCIDVLHSYYWYIPNEMAVNTNRFRGMPAKLHRIREAIVEAALHVATFQFKEDDFAYLITATLSLNDMHQIIHLLSIVKRLISGTLFNFFNKDFLLEQFIRLHVLFRVSHPGLFRKTIEVLMLAHDKKFIEVSRSDHVLMILSNLPPNFASKRILNVALSMMKEYPEILPIASWIAFNVGKKAIAKLAKSLQPNPGLREKGVDYAMTVATLFKAAEHKKQKIIEFLVLSWLDELQHVYGTIEIVGNYLGYNPDDTKKMLLIKACKVAFEKQTQNPQTLIKLSLQFMFVHTKVEGNQLLYLFQQSPFADQIEQNAEKPQKKDKISANEVKQMLRRVPEQQNKINIRFDPKTGKWEDFQLAKNIVSIILSSQPELFIEYASVLCAFLIRESCDSSPSVPEVMLDPLLKGLISYEQHQKDIPFLNEIPPEEYTKFAFDALERFTHTIDASYQQKIYSEVVSDEASKYSRVENFPTEAQNQPPLDTFNDEVEMEEQKCARDWQSLWRSMTTTRAPWNKSLHKDMRVVHFKRDNSYCELFCPLKLRRNYKFDDHMQASFIRDSGNDDDAKAMLENYRAVNFALLKEIAPAQILEVDDIHEKSDESNKEQEKMIKSIEIQNCALVKPSSIKEIVFKISYDRFSISSTDGNITTVLFKDLKYVLRRTFCHHPTAIEFFTVLHNSYFIDFRGTSVDKVMSYFKTSYVPRDTIVQMSDFRTFFAESGKTNLWVERKISNFEYLMYLNIYSGRSFNSPSQYPFFPWILKDYTSSLIDLSNPDVYRDLSLPIGATNPQKFKELSVKCKELESMGIDPYLFSSGQVCPLSVYLWLMRMEPFTSLHIEIQGGKFDHAARTFSSIADSFRVVTTHMNNFRELTPEFFSSPEFLLNLNNFDLGKVENQTINDVILPPWAKDAFDFIYIQRKALESKYVSENINKWIDLTWGVKQRSENNLYKPEMYADIWDKPSSHDPDTRAGIEAVLSQVGQVPPQLFTEPHPARKQKFEIPPALLRPACIDIQMKAVIFSTTVRGINGKYFVILVNHFGACQTCRINVRKIMSPTQQITSVVEKPRHRMRSLTVSSDKSIIPSRSFTGVVKRKSSNNDPQIQSSSSFLDVDTLSDRPMQAQSQIPHGVKLNINIINGLSEKIGLVTPQSFTASGSDIIFVGDEGNDLYKISADTCVVRELLHHTCDIVGIATDGQWIAVAGRDARICLFKGNFYHASISTYCDSIRCLAMSSDFDALVCGTRDGSLLFCSLSRGEVVRVVDLEGKAPKSVLITKAFGFVLIYADALIEGQLQHYLILFNINGMKIRTSSIDCGVSVWETWKSNDSFDYVIMANERGNAYVFEAYYLNIGSAVNRCKKRIIHVRAIPECNSAIAITENAQIHVFPYSLK